MPLEAFRVLLSMFDGINFTVFVLYPAIPAIPYIVISIHLKLVCMHVRNVLVDDCGCRLLRG